MNYALGKISASFNQAGYFVGSLQVKTWPLVVLDIIIVAILIYWAYLFIRETRAVRILYGFALLAGLMLIGYLMNLLLLNWILKYIMAMLVVAIPVVFQPELRNALEKLGRSRFLTEFSRSESYTDIIEKIVRAVYSLSSAKTGALIVFQRKTGLREYIERGIKINADVTTELLQSIFLSKSPLHDGAIIIVGDKIVAAAVMLPVSEKELSSPYGSRHRAGIGITENSDAVSIIVSEESGTVSLAVNGEIERRIGEDRLKNRLIGLIRNK